jgi:hypothetical protein
MDKDVKNVDISQYPSVDLAYDFVKPSYDWMVTRFEAINSKIQGLLTFSVTITAAIPVIIKSIFNNISFTPWFTGALIAFIILVIIGVIGMRIGAIALLNPKTLYNKYLYCSHWEFQQRVLSWAGKHFSKNKATIDTKALFRDIMIGILLIEILCFVLWVIV